MSFISKKLILILTKENRMFLEAIQILKNDVTKFTIIDNPNPKSWDDWNRAIDHLAHKYFAYEAYVKDVHGILEKEIGILKQSINHLNSELSIAEEKIHQLGLSNLVKKQEDRSNKNVKQTSTEFQESLSVFPLNLEDFCAIGDKKHQQLIDEIGLLLELKKNFCSQELRTPYSVPQKEVIDLENVSDQKIIEKMQQVFGKELENFFYKKLAIQNQEKENIELAFVLESLIDSYVKKNIELQSVDQTIKNHTCNLQEKKVYDLLNILNKEENILNKKREFVHLFKMIYLDTWEEKEAHSAARIAGRNWFMSLIQSPQMEVIVKEVIVNQTEIVRDTFVQYIISDQLKYKEKMVLDRPLDRERKIRMNKADRFQSIFQLVLDRLNEGIDITIPQEVIDRCMTLEDEIKSALQKNVGWLADQLRDLDKCTKVTEILTFKNKYLMPFLSKKRDPSSEVDPALKYMQSIDYLVRGYCFSTTVLKKDFSQGTKELAEQLEKTYLDEYQLYKNNIANIRLFEEKIEEQIHQKNI